MKKPKPKAKAKAKAKAGLESATTLVGNVPNVSPGKYADGIPLHKIEYLNCKLILKPNRFVSRKAFFSFGKTLKRAGRKHGVSFSSEGYLDQPVKTREVVFVDTPDFRLYNNAFILRRRIVYKDGFPIGDPEVVFKFRHPDIQKAAEMDVRPNIRGDYRVKFKCQVLPLKDELGGVRMLFSHNVQFPRSNVGHDDVYSMDAIRKIFPALESLRKNPKESIQLVNGAIIEEVLQDIGELDFGDGTRAKVDVGIWRTRGEHQPLIAEFAFKFRFKDRAEMDMEAMSRFEKFFIELQYEAKDWLALGVTKTGIVYRMLGNKPTSHE